MGLFWAIFEIAKTPLSIVADVVSLWNMEEEKSFTRGNMEAIDRELKDTFK